MGDREKNYPCPICIRGKYKENALIQHLIDKHPDYPASKNINTNYTFPRTCGVCSQKLSTPVAMMTHYSQYHTREYENLKTILGFDFANPNVEFDQSQPLDIIYNLPPIQVNIIRNDQDFFPKLSKYIENSPIMYSILQKSNLLIICSSIGINLMDLRTPNLGIFLTKICVNQVPIIAFLNPAEAEYLKQMNICLSTNILDDPFSCTKFPLFVRTFAPPISQNEDDMIDITKKILKTDLRKCLINIAIAYAYLSAVGYFPRVQNIQEQQKKARKETTVKCPCCDTSSMDMLSTYRHLFRMHQFPQSIMNQFKLADQPKGVFVCDKCHEKNIRNFDDLMVHVYNHHRCDLLQKTLIQMKLNPGYVKEYPELMLFLEKELENVKTC
ncbi:hypothetical protein TRFO_06741 [Tritrichomonas foetus]|uniref:C2H2-type domain-containing protein n=1 Tax=Tritrichomonas foetus TaxID=1144522 RepID=A0A1J4JVB8_9EUKA|nr:hypothetical protein TRFO_06741 [Tritrichomonas foetus]|eukprot:OHT03103.1 hypothetical protein TRFO_06741 [Tritrichomonas foetus]